MATLTPRRLFRRLRLSVATKIVLLSFTVAVIFAAVGSIALVQSQRLTAQLDEQYQRDVVALSHMSTLSQALYEQHAAVLSHVLSDPGFYRNNYTQLIAETDVTIDQNLRALDQLDLTPQQRSQLRSLEALLPAWRGARDQALEASTSGDRAKATSMVLVRSQALGEALQNRVGQILANLDQAVANGARDARASSDGTTRLILLCLGIAVVLAVTLSIMVARTIVRPLRQAVTVLRQVEAGDFSQRLIVRTRDEVGQMAHSLNRTLDVLEDSFATMRYQASHDSLTGLANRTLFRERVAEVLADRAAARDSAILLIDLNDFKRVNDHFGHAVGDELLIEIGERLRRHVRPIDLAARLGGDEFGVLVDKLTSPEEALSIAGSLQRVIDEPVVINGTTLCPTASIGIAPWRGQRSVDKYLHEADVAMYAVKSANRTDEDHPTDP